MAYFNLAKCRAKLRTARKITTYVSFWDRIHAIAQPVEYFNRLLSARLKQRRPRSLPRSGQSGLWPTASGQPPNAVICPVAASKHGTTCNRSTAAAHAMSRSSPIAVRFRPPRLSRSAATRRCSNSAPDVPPAVCRHASVRKIASSFNCHASPAVSSLDDRAGDQHVFARDLIVRPRA